MMRSLLRSSWLGLMVFLFWHSGAELLGQRMAVSGITEPILDVTLGAPVSGIIGALHYEEGAFVKKGALVLELEKRTEELEAKRRALVLDPLKIDLDATRALFNKNVTDVREEELIKRELEYNVAVVDHELAEEEIRKRRIFTPTDGYIAEIFLDVGEACQVQQPLVRIVETRRCYFVANVEARAGWGLKVGQEVELEIETGASAASVPGKISFVSPVVDAASGLVKVKVIFENENGQIRPGVAGKMFLEGELYVN